MTEPIKEIENDIDQLNGFLRGEISAVEAYAQVIDKLDDPVLERQLLDLRTSHAERVSKLRARVQALGGEPAEASGAWGAVTAAIEAGAKLFGKSAAVSTLEEGEDYGNKMYADNLEELSPSNKMFVHAEIMPEQHRTHDALSSLQHHV